jgi:hypothetical protein
MGLQRNCITTWPTAHKSASDESYWSGNFHEQLDLFQESCRKAMERRSRLLKQMDGHPVYLKWERFLPLFHDPDAKYVGNPLWGRR